MPYIFIGDEGFPLLPSLLRPYGGRGHTKDQKVFNYRHSRGRRVSVVENAFGILAVRLEIFPL